MSGSASDKQLEGSVDEFYVFPCILESTDVKKVKGFCDRHGEDNNHLIQPIVFSHTDTFTSLSEPIGSAPENIPEHHLGHL